MPRTGKTKFSVAFVFMLYEIYEGNSKNSSSSIMYYYNKIRNMPKQVWIGCDWLFNKQGPAIIYKIGSVTACRIYIKTGTC